MTTQEVTRAQILEALVNELALASDRTRMEYYDHYDLTTEEFNYVSTAHDALAAKRSEMWALRRAAKVNEKRD